MWTEAARALWSILAEASLRATIAAALAAVILFVTRTRAAAVRHAVWASVTAAMLAMPLLPRAVPAVPVAALPPMELWAAALSTPDPREKLPGAAVRTRPISFRTRWRSTRLHGRFPLDRGGLSRLRWSTSQGCSRHWSMCRPVGSR